MSDKPDDVFRLGYVPGVTPAKWARVWRERLPRVRLELVQLEHPTAERSLRAGEVDALLGRLPIVNDDVLHAIPLYTETTVVVAPRDHVITAADELVADDLVDEVTLQPLDDPLRWHGVRGSEPDAAAIPGQPPIERPATTVDAIALAAAGVGVVIVPQSVARLHHRKDVESRPIVGVPQSRVALVWLQESAPELVEELVGIVRGRTANSSRGPAGHRSAAPVAAPARKVPLGKSGGRRSAPGKKSSSGRTKRRGGR